MVKAFLMHRDRDFDLQRKLPWNEGALSQDLGLRILFNAMAQGDRFVFEVISKAILASLSEIDAILYRQDVLKDCLNNNSVLTDLYNITVEVLEREKKEYFGLFRSSPGMTLYRSRSVLEMLISMLKRLRAISDDQAVNFKSEGFTRFFAMLREELDEDFFASAQTHLKRLRFRNGILISAELGHDNKGINYMLRRSPERRQSWKAWLFGSRTPGYSFQLHPRDESGARVLSELADRGLNFVANTLAQSVDHILSFFSVLRTELAFYIGCVNLHRKLLELGEPMSFPEPAAAGERRHVFQELYDVGLALSRGGKVVGNTIDGDGKDCLVVTGANQGGKSTFLRSIGLAQLMMQSGMFVPARSFSANLCDGLFTHFKREEDVTMTSGKLDEELVRMSEVVDNLRRNSLILFNESFAATNVREGSEISRQIVTALIENRVKIFAVTHLYEFANNLYMDNKKNVLFLRAQRQKNGARTFKLHEGEPLQTSYGEDLYKRIFLGQTSQDGIEKLEQRPGKRVAYH
jgi:DNA mismatch repair ATPase MutS